MTTTASDAAPDGNWQARPLQQLAGRFQLCRRLRTEGKTFHESSTWVCQKYRGGSGVVVKPRDCAASRLVMIAVAEPQSRNGAKTPTSTASTVTTKYLRCRIAVSDRSPPRASQHRGILALTLAAIQASEQPRRIDAERPRAVRITCRKHRGGQLIGFFLVQAPQSSGRDPSSSPARESTVLCARARRSG